MPVKWEGWKDMVDETWEPLDAMHENFPELVWGFYSPGKRLVK